MKRLAILGSTGSIGTQVLEVVSLFRDRFSVEALGAGHNLPLLQEQIRAFSPRRVAVRDEALARTLLASCGGLEVLWGEEGLAELASDQRVDIVVVALTGAIGFKPTLVALECGKRVALATKEVLVMAGKIVMAVAQRHGAKVIPIDSEHSAIFQLLEHRPRKEIRRLILTASGGPFHQLPPEAVRDASPEEALRHPVWKMGPKVSVDSATLMNKGLEIIEAHWLFGVPPSRIEVLIHPQGVVHGMVELGDGSILVQMGPPDMRIPIAYALSYPERLPLPYGPVDLGASSPLTFERPDPTRFPALGLAYEALRVGGTMPAVLSAADEMAVEAFLRGDLPFGEIVEVVREVMERHSPCSLEVPEDALEADRWARSTAQRILEERR